MRRAGAALGLPLALAACQLAFPVDGYTGGERPGSAGSGPGLDAGSSPEDGEAGAAPSPYCKSRVPPAVFCADFDEGSFLAGWSSSSSVPGSTIDLDPSAHVSPPASLVASLPDGNGSTRVFRTVEATLSFVHVELELRVDAFDSSANPNAAFCPLALDLGSGHELRLVTGRLRTYLEEKRDEGGGTPAYQGYDFGTPIPVSTWAHVVVELDVTASPPTARATVDDAPAVTAKLDPSWRAGAPVVAAGAIFAVNSVSSWKAHLDDVLVSGR